MSNNGEVKEKVKLVQSIVFNMLCDIDDYCRKNNIRYFLSGGTCLGAVRHNGFIPWDDDADLMMPRPDYERFVQNFGRDLSDRYGLESLKTNPEWHRPASRVWDKNTKVEAKMFEEKTIGVFIDIFPIDGLPKGQLKQRLYYTELKFLNAIRNTVIRKGFWEDEKYRMLKKILSYMTHRMDPRKLALIINNIALKYPFDTSQEVAASLALHYGHRETIKRELMEKAAFLTFEGRKLPVPIGYDIYLSNLYGEYMKIPVGAEERGYTHLAGYDIRIGES